MSPNGDSSGPASSLPTAGLPKGVPGPVGKLEPAAVRVDVLHGRFVPGDVVAGRYRIASLLGRGGMGEVYRADDLKLGQTVALKFLPNELSSDRTLLAALVNEVRSARLVTHQNVVRVHDIGEHEGESFLSMEFVDGETLESLLRRIGRLPHAKAAQLARQICAGLASVHDRGLLHRDLKPANVMIDGRGQARITDCGLAHTGDAAAGRFAVGTPGYMAPETVELRVTTVRADVYSLGLVLYELFTGQRAYGGEDPAGVFEQQRSRDPDPPSHIAPDIDPAAARVIQRCLERDPDMRPSSVREAALGLPGADPLAAAIAAGETPSPELVAAGGRLGLLRLAPVLALLGAFCTLAVLGASVQLRGGLLAIVPLEKSPEVLADRAENILRSLGYPVGAPDTPRRHRVFAYDLYEQFLAQVQETDLTAGRWERLRRARPSAVDFWYRSSTKPFASLGTTGVITMDDPAAGQGDITLRLSPAGQLRELMVVSPNLHWATDLWRSNPPTERTNPAAAPDAGALFAAADLNIADFTPVEATRVPPVYAASRYAWVGFYPEYPDEPVRVEAAWSEGKLVSFRLIERNWQLASTPIQTSLQAADDGTGLGETFAVATFLACIGGGLLLARHNLRLRRGDKRSARSIATLVSFGVFLQLVCNADTPLSAGPMGGNHVFVWIAVGLLIGMVCWLLYIAIEPYARRMWPESMVGWTRLLARRPGDPLVGQGVLVGTVLGALAYVVNVLNNASPAWLGEPPARPFLNTDAGVIALNGLRHAFSLVIQCGLGSLQFALVFVVGFVLFHLLFRRKWAAAVAFALLQTLTWTLPGPINWVTWLLNGLLAVVAVVAMARLGLLTIVVAAFVFNLFLSFPVPPRTDLWYAPAIMLGLAPAVLFAVWGALGSAGLLRSQAMRGVPGRAGSAAA